MLILFLGGVVGDVACVSEVNIASIFRVHPEDGGTMYLRNVTNVAYDHMVQQSKNKINIKTYRSL
jgi:hypothetical protein